MIIGHKSIIEYFDKVIAAGNLSHAYLLVGPQQVGKSTIAHYLAAKLLHVDEKKLSIHADFSYVAREKDPKTDKTKKNIDIARIRELRHFLELSSEGYKVVVIDGAQHMSSGAANALLKSLEEPKANAVLFLTTPSEHLVLSTIRSRCQKMYVDPVSDDELLTSARENNMDESLVPLARGLPGRFVDFQDEAIRAQTEQSTQAFLNLFGKPYYEKLQLVDEYFGDKTDHIAARDRLVSILNDWEFLIGQHLYSTMGVSAEESAIVCDNATLLKIYDNVQVAKEELQNNIHPKLLVENILLSIP
ncbi:AAA family ATPase [Candidatus Nomurabacteria bacterium]|nr:AAA family ATPase [Candidatus Nomurabacteria bacterium]